MNSKIIIKLFASAIVASGAAVGLQLLGLSPFVIILGFRFHVCLVISGLFFIMNAPEILFHSVRYAWGRLFGLLCLLLIVSGIPFVLIPAGIASFHKGENFFELGVSSIFDFPIYFIWNLPQFLMLYCVLKQTVKLKASLFYIVLFIVILAVPLFIPFSTPLPVWSFAQAGLLLVIISLLVNKSLNWIEFTINLFFILWSTVLLFGTENEMLVKIFLGKNYNSWEGFIVSKAYSIEVLRTTYLAVVLVISALLRKRRNIDTTAKNA